MLDLSQFEKLAKNFPRNIKPETLKSPLNTYMIKFGRATRFSIFVYSTPFIYIFYQIYSRSFSTYYQNYPQKTEFSFLGDYNTNTFVNNNRVVRNSLEFN